MAQVAIVIVAHASGGTLAECIRRALANLNVAELVLVDNASDDGSIEPIEQQHRQESRLRILRNSDNRGFACACNQGAATSRSEWLLFLNPDCLLESDTVARLLEAAASVPKPGVIGADVRAPDGSAEAAARRRDPTPGRALISMLGLDRFGSRRSALAGVAIAPTANAAGPSRVDAVSGALMLVPRDAFERLGGFDQGYPLHAEDLDLCRRARDAGYDVVVAEGVRVTHIKGGSSRRAPLRVAWHKHRGLWRYYRKFDAARQAWPLRVLVWLAVFGHFALLSPWWALKQAFAAGPARA